MTDVKEVELESLIGPHTLDAVDESSQKIKIYDWSDEDDCSTISFRLDGIVYTAVEDPSDGYRSSMRSLFADAREMKNVFPAVQVVAKKKSNDRHSNDTLELIDVVTGKIVLEVGTDNNDDYYPWFVGTFTPENMATNANRKRK